MVRSGRQSLRSPARAPGNLGAMSTLGLSKLHGAGNDFVVTVAPDGRGPGADVAARLCDRHVGIGADGLITLLPGRDGADCTIEPRTNEITAAQAISNGIRCLSWELP